MSHRDSLHTEDRRDHGTGQGQFIYRCIIHFRSIERRWLPTDSEFNSKHTRNILVLLEVRNSVRSKLSLPQAKLALTNYIKLDSTDPELICSVHCGIGELIQKV